VVGRPNITVMRIVTGNTAREMSAREFAAIRRC
jgi:hypothetical protein